MSSTPYITVPIQTDPRVLAQNSFTFLSDKIAGWEPNEGQFDVIMLEAKARMIAELMDVASAVPTAIFIYYGQNIIGLQPISASHATGETTWTVKDTAGYTIPSGTEVGVRLSGDVLVLFQVTQDVVIPPGDTTTATGGVQISALDSGSVASNITGAVELVTALEFVTDIVLAGPTSGGVDGETVEAYLTRLVRYLQLLAPRPILPDDFAAMALNVAGVARALALDMYDPATDTFDNERQVTTAVVDADGLALSGGVKTEVKNYLESHREASFKVNVIDPSYTDIDVTFSATALPGWDPIPLEPQAEAAVSAYLSPATWGLPPQRGDQGGAAPAGGWIQIDTVRYNKLIQVIENVQGIDYVSSMTIGIDGGSMGTSDITLLGRAPLARPKTIAGTVVGA